MKRGGTSELGIPLSPAARLLALAQVSQSWRPSGHPLRRPSGRSCGAEMMGKDQHLRKSRVSHLSGRVHLPRCPCWGKPTTLTPAHLGHPSMSSCISSRLVHLQQGEAHPQKMISRPCKGRGGSASLVLLSRGHWSLPEPWDHFQWGPEPLHPERLGEEGVLTSYMKMSKTRVATGREGG